MKRILLLPVLLLLAACAPKHLARDEWTIIQADCREYARLSVAEAFGTGSIGNEEEVYEFCLKDALDSPRNLEDVRRKIDEASTYKK
jgi:hypothetical protein